MSAYSRTVWGSLTYCCILPSRNGLIHISGFQMFYRSDRLQKFFLNLSMPLLSSVFSKKKSNITHVAFLYHCRLHIWPLDSRASSMEQLCTMFYNAKSCDSNLKKNNKKTPLLNISQTQIQQKWASFDPPIPF